MKCPRCLDPMIQTAVGQATLYECRVCQGMWFDEGEFDAVKGEVMPDLAWLDLDVWKEQAEFKVQITPNHCPACRDIALTKVQDPHSATEVDICPRCKGAWLGTGQFLNLVNTLLDEANRISAPEYVKISLQKTKEILTHREEIDTDWQDLKTVLKLLKHRLFVENPNLESILVGLQKSMPL